MHTIPRHYIKQDAEWLASALAALPGKALPYWCSPASDAVIVSAAPYKGVYDSGVFGFAVSLCLHCDRGAGQIRTVPTVLEAREVARLTGLALPCVSRWL